MGDNMNKPRKISFVSKIKNEFLNPVEGKKQDSVLASERRIEEICTGPDCIS